MRSGTQLREDDGYALILAIMLLTILVISGTLVSNMSVTDLQAVRNLRSHSQNKAAAESAAMNAVQLIENEDNPDDLYASSSSWGWLNDKDITDDKYNEDPITNKWGILDSKTLNVVEGRLSSENGQLRYRAIGWSVSRGTSLGAYEASLKEGKIRGVYYTPSTGIYSVEMGFKKRF